MNELAAEEAEAARADAAEGVADDDKYAELKKGAATKPAEVEGGSSGTSTKPRTRKTSFNFSRDHPPPPPPSGGAGESKGPSPVLRRSGGAEVRSP